MRPADATLIVVGDVKPDAVRAQLARAFADWKPVPGAAPTLAELVAAPAAPRLVLVDKPGAPQTELRIGHPSVPRNTPDYFPLIVTNVIFGGMFSSRLNMNLRELHGYTYGIRSDVALRREGGPFVIGAPVKTGDTAPSLKEALAELDRLRAAEVTREELRLAKDLLERQMARRFETAGAIAAEIANIVVYRLPEDYLAKFAGNVEAVTAADVLRVAKQHLDPARLTITLVGDREKIAPGLTGLGLPAPELRDSQGKVLPAAPAKPTPATTPAKPAATDGKR